MEEDRPPRYANSNEHLLEILKQELIRGGYTIELSNHEERVIRPDGSVVVIARKK